MTQDTKQDLEIMELHKAYGPQRVLRGFSGRFPRGRLAALVGPNGAGKTTLLRTVAGLQHADSGVVRAGRVLYYGGFDVLPARTTIDRLRRALGLGSTVGGRRVIACLSRGEMQQAGLDIAIELAPEVLLLDEPWTALEPDARESLNEKLRTLAADHIVVCSSHDLDEVARVADDVVFLSEGVAIWKRREEFGGTFDRNELIRIYRAGKTPTS